MLDSIRGTYAFKYIREYIGRLQVKINPEKEVDRCYFSKFKKHWNPNNPQDLIEKIFWMELYSDTSVWSLCADKYRMREYIENLGLGQYLPKNYGHWEKVNDIDFNALPDEFVLKTNNGCGTVMVVKEKKDLDIRKTKKALKQWLRMPYGSQNAQLHYMAIKPCVIAEELLCQDEYLNSISPNSMVDFKVWCLNGEPENILLVYDRNKDGYCLDLYDTKWNRIDENFNKTWHSEFREESVKQPECLMEMLSIAKKIAETFPEVRVDFYIVNGKPVIGELTFSTGYGYFTYDYYKYMGGKVDLSKVKQISIPSNKK